MEQLLIKDTMSQYTTSVIKRYYRKKENIKDKILKTKDYDLFSFIKGNMKINRSKVERFKKTMANKRILPPIFINDKHEIIDGQHRFTAIREMKLPLNYIIIDE